MKITAIYPGTFDPITLGHVDIITRASMIFTKVFFAIADVQKDTLLSVEERFELAKSILFPLTNVQVCSFDKLVTASAVDLGANVIIRSIRSADDFDYESQMAGMNRRLCASVETVFLKPAEHLSFISSTLVKEIASLGGDVSEFVDQNVVVKLKSKFSQ